MSKPFNLYFAGFGCKEADPVLMNLSSLRLLSYHLDKPRVEKWNDADREVKSYHADKDSGKTKMSYHEQFESILPEAEVILPPAEKLTIFLDSGAFSAHTKGAQLDVDDYISYINDRDEHLTCYAQLDTIPGEFGKPKTRQQLEEAPEKSWENYLYMVERVKSPEKLQPIFHQGEDFKHLHRILNHEPRVDYMGISPANDLSTQQKEMWIAECFNIIRKSKNPDIKTHAFGMTSLRLLEQFPFYSADSTSWLMNGKSGNIMSKYGTLTISKNLMKDKKHVFHMGVDFRRELSKYVADHGFDIEELAEDYKKRMLFNIYYLTDWANNYEYKPKKIIQTKLFY